MQEVVVAASMQEEVAEVEVEVDPFHRAIPRRAVVVVQV